MMVLLKLTILFAVLYATRGWHLGPYARLLDEIKRTETTNDIPINKKGDPVELKMTIYPVNIFDADPVSKTVSLNAWLVMTWNSSLTWSPEEFGGVDQIAVPYNYMWIPGILNGLNGFGKLEDEIPNYVWTHASGLAKWQPRYTFRSLCDFDEDQLATNATCALTIGTMYMSSVVKFADRGENGVDMNYYFSGSRYEILEASSATVLGHYDGLPYHPVSQFVFKFSFDIKNTR